MKYLRYFAVFMVMMQCISILSAQKEQVKYDFDSSKVYLIDLKDGSRLFAKVMEVDGDKVRVKVASNAPFVISYSQIASAKEVLPERIKNGKYWFENPHATRYLFAPSARNLKKGEWYYQNAYLVLNSFNYGVTDYFSIGGGLEIISTLAFGRPLFFITPKVGFEVSEKLNLGGGIIYYSTDDNRRRHFGIGYGIATYGTSDRNLTAGVGWGYFYGEFLNKPIVVLSGMSRVRRRWSLISENWIAYIEGEYQGIFSYGVRFFGEKMAVDLAFLVNKDIFEALFPGVPYVDFVVKF